LLPEEQLLLFAIKIFYAKKFFSISFVLLVEEINSSLLLTKEKIRITESKQD